MTQQTDYHKAIAATEVKEALAAGINQMVDFAHGVAVQSGWWLPKGEAKMALELLNDDSLTMEQEVRDLLLQVATKPRNVGEALALVHSEVSEAMEAARKNLNDDHLTDRKGLEVELGDAVIRIFDLAGGLGLDLGGAIVEKMAYNTKRADHKPENREKDGGKQF
jgi:NTP pyrophosphatase (non-canonical NTP hydrolase)